MRISDWSSDVCSSDLGFRSFLDRLGISRAVFSGSSFGALWLQFFAARFPDYVAGALLATAFIDSQFKQALFDHMLSMSGSDVVAAVKNCAQASAGKSAEKSTMTHINRQNNEQAATQHRVKCAA